MPKLIGSETDSKPYPILPSLHRHPHQAARGRWRLLGRAAPCPFVARCAALDLRRAGPAAAAGCSLAGRQDCFFFFSGFPPETSTADTALFQGWVSNDLLLVIFHGWVLVKCINAVLIYVLRLRLKEI